MSGSTTPIDLLVHSGALWTPRGIIEEGAIAVHDGVIVDFGTNDEVGRRHSSRRQELDARGGLVTPSFADAHLHAAFAGVEQNRCELSAYETAEEILSAIAAYAAEHPSAEWILGGGWSTFAFPGGSPSADQLDALVPDRPVHLISNDHHSVWANSRAMRLAGVTTGTPDPAGGRIERDPTGIPSGAFHEEAVELLSAVLPPTPLEEVVAGIEAAQRRLFSCGITAWHEAILGGFSGYPDITPAYANAFDSGALRATVGGALWIPRDLEKRGIDALVTELVARRSRYEQHGLRISAAKIMVDGVTEIETAAYDEPYESVTDCSCPGTGTGTSFFSRDQLLELIPALNAAGFDAHFHAIGNRAIRHALDAVENVPAALRSGRRNQIAHLQVIDPDDLSRFAGLGVTANIQPLWACSDDLTLERTIPLLGERRAQRQFLFGSLLRSGATLACGSDWPVTSPDPWAGIHVAVNRLAPGETERAPLLAGEAIPLDVAIHAYTTASHDLIGSGAGRIEAGGRADLAIADRNPFANDAQSIFETRNRVTLCGGEIVHHG